MRKSLTFILFHPYKENITFKISKSFVTGTLQNGMEMKLY